MKFYHFDIADSEIKPSILTLPIVKKINGFQQIVVVVVVVVVVFYLISLCHVRDMDVTRLATMVILFSFYLFRGTIVMFMPVLSKWKKLRGIEGI